MSERPRLSLSAVLAIIGGPIAVVISMLWVGIAVMAWVPSLMSVMMFDAPGSEDSLLLKAAVIAIFTFPYVALFGALLAWFPLIGAVVLGVLKKPRGALVAVVLSLVVQALPLVNVALLALALGAMSLFCGGDLACF